MLELQGIPVSPGVAIGPALVLDADGYRVPRTIVAAEQAAVEYSRLRDAVDSVSSNLETHRLETAAVAGEDTGDIFAAQLQMLHDPRLQAELGRRIRDQLQQQQGKCCTGCPALPSSRTGRQDCGNLRTPGDQG